MTAKVEERVDRQDLVKSDRLDVCFCMAARSGGEWDPEKHGFGEQPGHVHIEKIREALGLPAPEDGKR